MMFNAVLWSSKSVRTATPLPNGFDFQGTARGLLLREPRQCDRSESERGTEGTHQDERVLSREDQEAGHVEQEEHAARARRILPPLIGEG